MRTALFAAVALALAGCPAAKNFTDQVQSNTVMVSTLLASPDESVAGKLVKGKVAASVFLGTRDPANLDAPPQGVAGAQVTLGFNGQIVVLQDKGQGNYAADSTSASNLVYTVGATYQFEAQNGDQKFDQSVGAPEREEIAEFHTGLFAYDGGIADADGGSDGGAVAASDGGISLGDGGIPGFVAVHASTDLVLTRPASTSQRNIAMTTVVPITTGGPQSPSFTDPPLTPLGLIDLVAKPDSYEQPTVTVTGSKAWPTCTPGDFLITVTAVKKGTAEGNNLFPSSLVLAGSADAAPARCQ